MTPSARHSCSGWRPVAAASAALLLASACSPAEKAAPAPPPMAPASPVAPSASTPAAAAPAAPVEQTPPAAAPAPAVVAPPVAHQTPPARPAETPPPAPAPVPAPPLVTPARTGLPPGAGRETVQQVCTSCHAIGMVTANGRTSDGWAEVIERMMGLGLEASDEDLQTVHAYLTRELPPRRTN